MWPSLKAEEFTKFFEQQFNLAIKFILTLNLK